MRTTLWGALFLVTAGCAADLPPDTPPLLSWSVETLPTNPRLLSIWGSGPTDLWITGTSGTLLHSKGDGTWQAINSSTGSDLRGICAMKGDLYAVGTGGTIIHSMDGSSFQPVPSQTSLDLSAIACSDLDERVFIAGEGVTLQGTAFAGFSLTNTGATTFQSLWYSPNGWLYGVSATQELWQREPTADGWTRIPGGQVDRVTGSGENLVAVGTPTHGSGDQTIASSTNFGHSWNWRSVSDGCQTDCFDTHGAYIRGIIGIWLSPSSKLFATDGSLYSFQPSAYPLPWVLETTESVEAIWGSSDSDVYAIGQQGVLHGISH